VPSTLRASVSSSNRRARVVKNRFAISPLRSLSFAGHAGGPPSCMGQLMPSPISAPPTYVEGYAAKGRWLGLRVRQAHHPEPAEGPRRRGFPRSFQSSCQTTLRLGYLPPAIAGDTRSATARRWPVRSAELAPKRRLSWVPSGQAKEQTRRHGAGRE
jgi:hypothetical protein